jgi:hypothetical protein
MNEFTKELIDLIEKHNVEIEDFRITPSYTDGKKMYSIEFEGNKEVCK